MKRIIFLKKCFFCETMAWRKNPGGKGGVLVHRRICEKNHLWKNPGGKGGALSTGEIGRASCRERV